MPIAPGDLYQPKKPFKAQEVGGPFTYPIGLRETLRVVSLADGWLIFVVQAGDRKKYEMPEADFVAATKPLTRKPGLSRP